MTALIDTTTRPDGQPGTVARQRGKSYGWSYPAVQLPDGKVAYWRDTETTAGKWLIAPPGLAASFEQGPEWQADCRHHDAGAPYRTCDSETDCVARRHEDGMWS